MHEALQHWIGRNLQRPEIRAFGVRLHDKSCFSHSFSPEFTAEKLDATWHSLMDTINGLTLQRVPAHRLRWTFEAGQIYFSLRTDGIALGLITSFTASEEDRAAIDSLIEEFLRLNEFQ